jgi:hypothetical protein
MLTIVMLNWARPQYLVRNLYLYSSYRIVDRVFCFNNGPALQLRSALPRKCVLIEASTNLGLYTRLSTASLSHTEAIFHTDDDISVPEETLEALFMAWRQAPSSCHGLYGRLARPLYKAQDAFGPVDIVLTRALVCSRRVNNAALSVTPLFEDLTSVPAGNGEDIILSFAAISLSRSMNLAYRLHSVDYPVPSTTAIHRTWSGHYEHRTKVVHRCRQVFSL